MRAQFRRVLKNVERMMITHPISPCEVEEYQEPLPQSIATVPEADHIIKRRHSLFLL